LRTTLKNALGQVRKPDNPINVYNAFDIVGDIVVLKLPHPTTSNAKVVAETLMSIHRNVQAVFAQESSVKGEYRLRKLTCIGGENRTHTQHKEAGCIFSVDLASCYFSPRLQGERQRIARLIQPNEVVVNMFAGVGCFSILIAKQMPSATVYSIDINPQAFTFMQKNIQLNNVHRQVTPMLGDAKPLIENDLQGCADRVLMPLPEKALEYLPAAVSALKPSGGWLHVHLFEHASKNDAPIEQAKQRVAERLNELSVVAHFSYARVVRHTGPNWHQIVLDLHTN
jgi:tRNA (guanine37-N1)-methyltransferase